MRPGQAGSFALAAVALALCLSACKNPAPPVPPPAASGPVQANRMSPTVSLFGVQTPAERVCYVYDYGGELLVGFQALAAEIKASIARLSPGQSFDVIPIGSKHPFASGSLAPASPEEKDRAGRFLDETFPSEEEDPVAALDLAFRQKPQVVFLVSNGDFPDNKAVHDWLAAHNKDKAVVVNTIALVPGSLADVDNVDVEFLDLLETIARLNSGQFRKVRDRSVEPGPSR
jgi:hypothetical protein